MPSDIAAAYLVRWEAARDPVDAVWALDFADRAAARDAAHSAAAFNRAWALEAAGLSGPAAAARESLAELISPEWLRDLESLVIRIPAPPGSLQNEDVPLAEADVARLVATWPDVAFTRAERDLARWAEEVISGESARAEARLQSLQALARALSNERQQSLLAEAVREVGQADFTRRRALAEAQATYEHAKALYDRRDSELAEAAFGVAVDRLAAAGSPYVGWARYYRVVSAYWRQSTDATLEALNGLADERQIADGRFAGRLDWMRGLLLLERGDYSSGIAAYRRALGWLENAKDLAGSSFLRVLLGDALLRLAEPEAALRTIRPALDNLAAMSPTHARAALSNAAEAATAMGLHHAALDYLDAAMAIARDSDAPMAMVEAHRDRALGRWRIGDRRGAGEDLADARRHLDGLSDSSTRRAGEALLAGVAMQLEDDTRHGLTLMEISEAISRLAAAGSEALLPEHLVTRGDALADGGRDLEAMADYRRALDLAEAQRSLISTAAWRTSFGAVARRAGESLLRLQVETRQAPEIVADVTEQVRDRWYESEGEGPLESHLDALDLPDSTALLSFTVLETGVLIWTYRNGALDLAFSPVKRPDLLAMVSKAARFDRRAGETAASRRSLYAVLITPVEPLLAGIDTLGVVSDPHLIDVPWQVLERSEGRHLVEDVAVAILPSMRALRKPSAISAAPLHRALVVGAPSVAPESRSGIRPLAFAEDEAAEVSAGYASSVLLLGEQAQREHLLRHLGDVEVAHLALHSIYNDVEPDLSRLVLAGDTREVPSALFANEIRGLDLSRLRVVVLASCEGARSYRGDPAGVLSLAASFLAAGAQSAVAAIGPVDDRSTASVFPHLHAGLRAGKPVHQALREALLEIGATSDEELVRAARFLAMTTVL